MPLSSASTFVNCSSASPLVTATFRLRQVCVFRRRKLWQLGIWPCFNVIACTDSEMRNLNILLAPYHAVVVEGPATSDKRDPKQVATALYAKCQQHWASNSENAPVKQSELILITQGDPPHTNGIAPICRELQDMFGVKRVVITWDEKHAQSADRYGKVAFELRYEELASALDSDADNMGDLKMVEQAIDRSVKVKNEERDEALPNYMRTFALLQEVSKAVLCRLCTGVTVIHTVKRDAIHKHSVTSFYQVGLDLNLVPSNAFVSF